MIRVCGEVHTKTIATLGAIVTGFRWMGDQYSQLEACECEENASEERKQLVCKSDECPKDILWGKDRRWIRSLARSGWASGTESGTADKPLPFVKLTQLL